MLLPGRASQGLLQISKVMTLLPHGESNGRPTGNGLSPRVAPPCYVTLCFLRCRTILVHDLERRVMKASRPPPPSLAWVIGTGWLLVCLLGVTACQSRGYYVDAPAYVPAESPPERRQEVVRVGDRISVLVFGEELLSVRNVRVGSRGTIALPLLGEVVVMGKPPSVIARELEKALVMYVTTPHVLVSIDQSPVVITVIGETRSNGRLEMEWPVRIVEALAQAGGLNEFADRSAVYVLRDGERIRFEYQDIIRGEKYAREFLMRTGDVLVVE